MAHIVELSPVLGDPAGPPAPGLRQGLWNSHETTARLAAARGHAYSAPAPGPVDRERLAADLAGADALVLAPTVATPTGMWQPVDGTAAGRRIGHTLLDRLGADRPDLHVVLVSHFLVGHGTGHHNAKPNTWALRAVEAHLRAGRNPWTILRPTWLSTVHDPAYQTRLSGDAHADGLVSTESVAAAVLAAVEHPGAARGRTAAIFNLSVPDGGATDLVAEFEALEPDFEAGIRSVAGLAQAVRG